MKTEIALARLIEATTARDTTAEALAAAMITTIERVSAHSAVGDEALAIVRNKILRKHLADVFSEPPPTTKRGVGRPAKLVHRNARPPMSAATRAKISKSSTARWRERKAEAKKVKGKVSKRANGHANENAAVDA